MYPSLSLHDIQTKAQMKREELENDTTFREAINSDTDNEDTFAREFKIKYHHNPKNGEPLTKEEIAENEQLWREENVDSKTNLSAQAELRGAGITSGGLSADMDQMGQSDTGPEDLSQPADMGAPAGGAPATPTTPAAGTAPV